MKAEAKSISPRLEGVMGAAMICLHQIHGQYFAQCCEQDSNEVQVCRGIQAVQSTKREMFGTISWYGCKWMKSVVEDKVTGTLLSPFFSSRFLRVNHFICVSMSKRESKKASL